LCTPSRYYDFESSMLNEWISNNWSTLFSNRFINIYDAIQIRRSNAGSSAFYSSCPSTRSSPGSVSSSSEATPTMSTSTLSEIATKVNLSQRFQNVGTSQLQGPQNSVTCAFILNNLATSIWGNKWCSQNVSTLNAIFNFDLNPHVKNACRP